MDMRPYLRPYFGKGRRGYQTGREAATRGISQNTSLFFFLNKQGQKKEKKEKFAQKSKTAVLQLLYPRPARRYIGHIDFSGHKNLKKRREAATRGGVGDISEGVVDTFPKYGLRYGLTRPTYGLNLPRVTTFFWPHMA